MLYSIYYGEISDERVENWDNGDENPYQVLKDLKKINCYDWVKFLSSADSILSDKIQIDWGSFAWKGNREQIFKLAKIMHASVEDRKKMDDTTVYGVVFIEEC